MVREPMEEYLDGIKYSLNTRRIRINLDDGFREAGLYSLWFGNSNVDFSDDRKIITNKITSQARIIFPSGHRHEYVLSHRGREGDMLVIVLDKNHTVIAGGDFVNICPYTFVGRSGACEFVKAHVEYHLENSDEIPLQPYLDPDYDCSTWVY
jgi:hypothetical protein